MAKTKTSKAATSFSSSSKPTHKQQQATKSGSDGGGGCVTRGVWELSKEVEIHVDATGFGARPPATWMQTFHDIVQKYPNNTALCYKSTKHQSHWDSFTWQQYYDRCLAFGKALIALGLQRLECVNILGFNSPEWFFAHNGTIAAGGVSAGIYATNGPEACQYISSHCDAKVVVVENRQQLDKYLAIAGHLPTLKALVMWKDQVPRDVHCPVKIYSFEEFVQLGAKVSDDAIQQRMDDQRPGQCCSLIYTSGTTGPPKAVMISHDNAVWASASLVHAVGGGSPQERSISFLPLSHAAAQLADIAMPFHVGSTVYFASPDVLKGSGLLEIMKEVRPTCFFTVPRVWEKIMEKMKEVGANSSWWVKSIASWAKALGAEKSKGAQFGADDYEPGWNFWLADRLVLQRIKAALGLDQCWVCVASAAPVSTEVLEYFGSLDLPLYELFGQSECFGPHSTNFKDQWKMGSIGMPFSGTETRIDTETGEIQYRGRHVFMGYLHNATATRETLTEDGWLCSGDIGTLDKDGFLSITGRIKELIVTAGGENVPPVLIEDALKTELSALANAMVIGDRRKYLTFVCSLRTEVDEEGNPTETLDRHALRIGEAIGSLAQTVAQARECDKWKQYITDGMHRVNAKATSQAQRVQKFEILPRDFSIAEGDLTPTLKLKRSVVLAKYIDLIDSMYAE